MKIWCYAVLVSLLFASSSEQIVGQIPTTKRLKRALLEFESSYRGKRFELTGDGVEKFIVSLPKNSDVIKVEKITVWGGKLMTKCLYKIPGLSLSFSKNATYEDIINIGTVGSFSGDLDGAETVLGFSYLDGMKFSDLAAMDSKSTVNKVEEDNVSYWQFSVNSDNLGEYKFWFDLKSYQLMFVSITKRQGDIFRMIDRDVFYGEKDLVSISEGRGEGNLANVQTATVTFGPIEYSPAGRPTGAHCKMTTRLKNGEQSSSTLVLNKVSGCVSIPDESSDLIEFETISIPNKMNLQVHRSPGGTFRIENGKLKRVVDREAITSIEKMKYRETGSGYYRNVTIASILFLIVASLLYIRHQRSS